ncbi:MAG: hypothetical protein EB023_10250 [Flavobacteriia bacterium]|nr:hypothetical protein [Flavobacteriia bacterium]
MHALRFILSLVFGLLVGAVVNGSIVNLGMLLFPFPEGVNFETKEGLSLFENLPIKYYIFPFLAHALGTLSGCIVALLFVRKWAKWSIYIIGYCFFVGGVMAGQLINAPLWFDILDLSLAYLPMAWLASQSNLFKKGQRLAPKG